MYKRKSVTVAYWAQSQLVFCSYLESYCRQHDVPYHFFQISHHPSWFTKDRSIFANVRHLGALFWGIIKSSFNSNLCIFGTNACRVLFLFSFLNNRTFYVYNELPCFNKKSPLYYWDRFIFRNAGRIYVSSQARSDYVKKVYKLQRDIGILENITVFDLFANTEVPRDKNYIFSGAVTHNRFSTNEIRKIESLVSQEPNSIDLYGVLAQDVDQDLYKIMRYQGSVSHAEMLKILPQYKYGILSYGTADKNNDLCAPIKIFEYLAAGCQIISVNRNKGICEIAEKYPSLVHFIDDGPIAPISDASFNEQAQSYMQAALKTNASLATEITA